MCNAFGNKNCLKTTRQLNAQDEKRHDVDYVIITSDEEIDKEVNKQIQIIQYKNNHIIDVRYDYVTVNHHNNGRLDTIILYVHILYEFDPPA